MDNLDIIFESIKKAQKKQNNKKAKSKLESLKTVSNHSKRKSENRRINATRQSINESRAKRVREAFENANIQRNERPLDIHSITEGISPRHHIVSRPRHAISESRMIRRDIERKAEKREAQKSRCRKIARLERAMRRH